jgi:hypothetical protein
MKRVVVPVVVAVSLLLLTASRSAATTIPYGAALSGAAEVPPNISPAGGFAKVVYDTVAHTLFVDVTFENLLGTTTASHIHAPTAVPLTGTAGVATTTPTFANFPLGVTSGHYVTTLDLTLASSYNPAYVSANGGTTAGAEAALVLALSQGTSYLNIHSSFAPGGEIRGFLVPTPEPGTLVLLSTGGVLWLRRRFRQQ